MRVSEQTQNQIMEMLRRLTEATGKKDVDAILAFTDPEFRGLGTGIDEKVIGKEEYRRHLERDFAQAEEVALELSGIHIGAEGTIAWVMADMTYRFVVDGVPRTMDGRMTAVLRGTGHAWIFAQLHYSFPAAGEEAGQSYPTA
ncbi:nuclear transport factor 2 family protein [Methanoculleus sp. Wushi-C6]|uniref:Nuclear transport factor 2 family protein n=1 Tax=Methanoculleus caldifontis TaxID=2651577 RepID=A0ABU3X1S9_9EURY|nr:nuclear transport factor 2 family protein [Methanoculleus sp. Wushi-C6]MDV2481995.1 nuclear transport factor 2 family protein [Methanoculleus sp. Wushi-C6]